MLPFKLQIVLAVFGLMVTGKGNNSLCYDYANRAAVKNAKNASCICFSPQCLLGQEEKAVDIWKQTFAGNNEYGALLFLRDS